MKLEVYLKNDIAPTYNVIGRIAGKEEPGEYFYLNYDIGHCDRNSQIGQNVAPAVFPIPQNGRPGASVYSFLEI